MAARTQADFNTLVTAAVTAPGDINLTPAQWQRVGSVVEPKIGAFGKAVTTALTRKLTAAEGTGDRLSEEESKHAIALLKIASQNAVGTNIPLGARAALIKSSLGPLAGMQFSESLKGLPDLVEAIILGG